MILVPWLWRKRFFKLSLIFTMLLLFPLDKWHDPPFEWIWIPLTQGCLSWVDLGLVVLEKKIVESRWPMYYYLPLEKDIAQIWMPLTQVLSCFVTRLVDIVAVILEKKRFDSRQRLNPLHPRKLVEIGLMVLERRFSKVVTFFTMLLFGMSLWHFYYVDIISA